MASTLHRRIESAVATAKKWDEDKALLSEIRSSIPFAGLVPELVGEWETSWRAYMDKTSEHEDEVQCKTECFRDDDAEWEGDDLLLKRLTLYFKLEVMTWCNRPPCANPECHGNEDGKQMEHNGVRGPETAEEKEGGAGRVEMYTCKLCNASATFPRYNSPRTLFNSRRGRCGEFANLFGAYCRAVGFDARYISDFTDHVWVEVWSVRQGRWLHADACEGLIDRPNMYEQGWGKQLNYAVGATKDSVADVTRRYTRKFYSDDFQARRREFAPDENASGRVFQQMDAALRRMGNVGKGRLDELDKRAKAEEHFFGMVQSSGVWDVEYREGRISGSHAWKAARQELGDSEKKGDGDGEGKDGEADKVHSFFVESFYPSSRHNTVTITVQPPAPQSVPTKGRTSHAECIIVSGVPCASTMANGISVVVVDEASGCILQSKAFSQWSYAGVFLDTVPDGRIVAICSISEAKEEESSASTSLDDSTMSHFSMLGGFSIQEASSTGSFALFIGQLNYHPSWAMAHNTSDSKDAIVASLQLDNPSPPKVRLRSENGTAPAIVTTRLPESIMPLKTQLAASSFQKRVAFNAYIERDSQNSSIVGYTTRPDAPVYLIDNQSFPFGRSGGQTSYHPNPESDTSWATYHFLPDPLVPDDDDIKEEAKASNASNAVPKFDVPVADDYFRGLLGTQLLVKNGAPASSSVDIAGALANTRLVALYFSAHWCGPCRSFTPMLIEMYNHLKEEFPTHGLEIVFVSSDRDEGGFQQYYRTMPFAALPFSNRAMAQQVKAVFGVRGIPSLVVIDSLSGTIVVPPDESRREVHQACLRGEEAIDRMFQSWLDRVPVETKSMLDILALSFQEAETGATSGEADESAETNVKAESYLVRKKVSADSKSVPSTKDSGALIKEIFAKLVAGGMEPNSAAAEAIKQATAQPQTSNPAKLEEGAIKGTSKTLTDRDVGVQSIESMAESMCQLNAGDKGKVAGVLATAKKYVANVQKDPSNPRFRNFRLSNKVFDQITSMPGSIQLLRNLGFVVFPSDVDFMASIPLAVDLSLMADVFDTLLKAYSS